jgi:hypothetical protein
MRYPHYIRCSLAVLLFGLCNPPAGAIGPTPPSWHPREIVTSSMGDAVGMVGADRSLAYDHHGNPGIAFYDAVNDDLRYARRVPGIGWVHSAVDTNGNVGVHPSLAYDRYERPAVSYFGPNTDLKYARFTGDTWLLESLDQIGTGGGFSSLAYDPLGRPAIAYQDGTTGRLRFVHDSDSDFSLVDETPVTVVNEFVEGNYASLVFDSLSRPMIAHQAGPAPKLRFSVREPGIGWVTTTVDGGGATGYYPSIAIDPDSGFPAMAYYDNSIVALRYANWNGASWNLTTVDEDTGDYPSLAFDSVDGNPAIAYSDHINRDLKLAWHDGNAWQSQTVDAVGDVGSSPSLAFNDFGNGFPSISYFDFTTSLFFVEDPPTVPEPASMILIAVGMALASSTRKRRLIVR